MEIYDDAMEGESFNEAPSVYACERFEQQIDELLMMMDRPEATVTNESQFFDFYSGENNEWNELKDRLMENFEINVSLDSYIWEVAEKIHEYEM